MSHDSKAALACETYYYHAMIGLDVIKGDDYLALRDDDRPGVWDLNVASHVTADTPASISALLDTLAAAYRKQGYCRFSVTPFTPPTFIAHLAAADFMEHTPVIQMVLQDPLTVALPPGFRTAAVESSADWETLFNLVRTDHLEGARTQGGILDESITRGIVDGYRRKAGPCRFFLAYLDDDLCGYGSATNCPNGMGMVEDLFTLAHFRRRGIASSLISHCVGYARDKGAEDVLIGSLATEPPKHLYQRLGFQPVCLTRSFHKPLARQLPERV